ncbi:MAG: hypothetical protein ACYC61_11420 [Isosphaeraceae bacterium]
MYVINSSKWDGLQVIGHVKLMADAWLDMVSDDGALAYQAPLYSTLQLLEQFGRIIDDVSRQVLSEYHIRDAAEELLSRLDDQPWICRQYPTDVAFLRTRFSALRNSPSDSFLRSSFRSQLRGFIEKVRRNDSIQCQRDCLCDLVASEKTRFAQITRALGELTNDLMHLGHSRGYLHRWMLREVVGDAPAQRAYVEKMRSSPGLDPRTGSDYWAIFTVACPAGIPQTRRISFGETVDPNWKLPDHSPLKRQKEGRYAIVRVDDARDGIAALQEARRHLRRYLYSPRLDAQPSFNRTISNYGAAVEMKTGWTYEEASPRRMRLRELGNINMFYELGENLDLRIHNADTYHQFDRILYWIEQSRQSEELGALITLWTAMEFLCSMPGKSDLDAVVELAPLYQAKDYPLSVVADFWRFLKCVIDNDGLALGQEAEQRIEFRKLRKGASCNLLQLFEASIQDEAGSPIKPCVIDRPILHYKWRQVRRLDPARPATPAKHTCIWDDINALEGRVRFDLRSCYRARNSIVHDAAVDVSQMEQLSHRLHEFLATMLDHLIHQFVRNPTLSLVDLHRINQASHERWKAAVKEPAGPLPLAEILNPSTVCLS